MKFLIRRMEEHHGGNIQEFMDKLSSPFNIYNNNYVSFHVKGAS
jgi:hypothetical protein